MLAPPPQPHLLQCAHFGLPCQCQAFGSVLRVSRILINNRSSPFVQYSFQPLQENPACGLHESYPLKCVGAYFLNADFVVRCVPNFSAYYQTVGHLIPTVSSCQRQSGKPVKLIIAKNSKTVNAWIHRLLLTTGMPQSAVQCTETFFLLIYIPSNTAI